jgi:hypothetical protein
VSAIPVARAAIPLTPAIRPKPKSMIAAAVPISTPPISPSTGIACGKPGNIKRHPTEF